MLSSAGESEGPPSLPALREEDFFVKSRHFCGFLFAKNKRPAELAPLAYCIRGLTVSIDKKFTAPRWAAYAFEAYAGRLVRNTALPAGIQRPIREMLDR